MSTLLHLVVVRTWRGLFGGDLGFGRSATLVGIVVKICMHYFTMIRELAHFSMVHLLWLVGHLYDMAYGGVF
jgi:hypothetical protein